MHPVLGTMMPEICEAPHFSCQPRLHTQIVGMRSLHSPCAAWSHVRAEGVTAFCCRRVGRTAQG